MMMNDSLGRAVTAGDWHERWHSLEQPVARVARFAGAGAVSAGAQLIALAALLDGGLEPRMANVCAFLAAAQLNFVLNRWFTWRERRGARSVRATWTRFMAAIGATAIVNLGAFWVAAEFVPPMVAGAAGIAVVAAINFVVADRAVFAARDDGDVGAAARAAAGTQEA